MGMYELYVQASKLHTQLAQLLLSSAVRLYDSGELDLAKQVYYRSQAERMTAEAYEVKSQHVLPEDTVAEKSLDDTWHPTEPLRKNESRPFSAKTR